MKKKIRVLCFLDNPLGRDTEILLPVTFCMEQYFNCEVKFLFIWDALQIKIDQPDIILLPNTRGHNLYFEIAKFGHQCGITILALESEGNFPLVEHFDYWGYNTDKVIYQKILTTWSERVKKFLIQKNIASENKIITTGATGFDRYIFENHDGNQKKKLLAKYGLSGFKKVVGYAGWAFGKIYGREKESFAANLFQKNSDEANALVEDLREHVCLNLKQLINENPDILFILKKHPKEQFEDDVIELKNEMNPLEQHPNVLYLKKEEDIKDLISISDIWMGFETTTLLEAWLLKKPTILINKHQDFPRSELYKGSLIEKDVSPIQRYIDEYYNTGTISNFKANNLIQQRKKLVADSIGYGDGCNHLRVMKAFAPNIKQNSNHSIPINFRHLRLFLLMHLGRFFYHRTLFKRLPGFKKSIYVFENRLLPNFEKRKKQVYKELYDFHAKKEVENQVIEIKELAQKHQ